jgi:hypothetical protein
MERWDGTAKMREYKGNLLNLKDVIMPKYDRFSRIAK